MNGTGQTAAIYLVASRSGSIVSRAIGLVTRARYNHVSISLDSTLETMYSFGRRRPSNPFWGGFVAEHPGRGTLARFPETWVRVLRLDVTAAQYRQIREHLERMERNRARYGYNYKGLLLAAVNRPCPERDRYYCSEFVREVLVRFGVAEGSRFGPVTQPQQLLETLCEGTVIYEGLLTACPMLRPKVLPFARPMAAAS